MSWQAIRGVLLDIEGTTSSISFVYDQMFPYVRRALREFLVNGWQDAPVRAAVAQLSADAVRREAELQVASVTTNRLWPENAETDERVACVEQHVLQLMDADVKATGLKQLQGLIWQAGFEQGELIAHVYDDVLPALQRWQRNGLDVRVYSSGSVLAQQLFFGHTIAGDLLPYFKEHYDTTIGGKKEPASYQRIADAFALPCHEILFVSDIPEELDAARSVGLQTALSIRPGNPKYGGNSHVVMTSFAALPG